MCVPASADGLKGGLAAAGQVGVSTLCTQYDNVGLCVDLHSAACEWYAQQCESCEKAYAAKEVGGKPGEVGWQLLAAGC